jgi:hypothetical protein
MRSAKALLAFIMLVSLWMGVAVPAIAQTGSGQVNGTITDTTGAVVPTATVKLENQATKLENVATSNSTGGFLFVNVLPGRYTLEVSKAGFKTTLTDAFEVNVARSVSQPITLPVGNASETVEVKSEAPLVDATTTELGTVIEQKAVQDLPLNGLNFTQLLTLTPGVTPISTSQNKNVGCCEGNTGLPNSGFSDGSFHGANNRSKLYFYDGIINTNVRGPTYIVIPNHDLIQEFKVVGHDAKAEYGGAAGGVVNVVSKSGGDTLHGSGFWYVRNNFFDARNSLLDGPNGCTLARCPKAGQVVPSGPAPFHQNQFGATATGPIIKHRTFFSVAYDGWRFSQADQNLARVPTAAELLGDFSNSGSQRARIFNPYSTRISNPAACNAATGAGCNYTRDEFRCDASGSPLPVNAQNQQSQTTGSPCFKIPSALIDPAMKQFFAFFSPKANINDPTGTSNFVRLRSTLNKENGYTIRVDHRFRDADNVFFRYTEQRNTIFTPIGDIADTQGGSQGRNYGGGWTHLFSTNLILDVRAGYAGRPGVDAGQQNEAPGGLEALKTAGFVDVDKYHGLLATISGYNAGGNGNFGERGSAPRLNPDWSLSPSVSWLKGRHNIKVGAWYIDAQRTQLNTFATYSFSGTQTQGIGVSNTGNALASALLGFANSSNGQLPVPHGGPVEFKYAAWAGYVQDEWRLKPNLTITYGLRYDYVTQPQTMDGRLWNAIDLDKQLYIVGAKTLPGLCSQVNASPCIPDAFLKDPHAANLVAAGKRFFSPAPIKDNWGPRVGVAWQFMPKTVLRAGYGLYWDPITARSQYAQNNLEAYVWPDSTAFTGSVNQCGNGSTCAFTNGTGVNLVAQQKQGLTTPLPTYTGVSGLPWNSFPNNNENAPNYKDGYMQGWNLEIQRELSGRSMVSVAYVGGHGGRLPYTGNANGASKPTTCATSSCTAAENAQIDTLRLMPWVTAGISYSRSIGFSDYNALESRYQHTFSNGLFTLVSYTWGKSTDTTSGYFNGAENGPQGTSTIQNYFNPVSAHGQSSFNISHFLSWATSYELPAGHGKRFFSSGPLAAIVGDWSTNYIFQARSGQPYGLLVSGDIANLRGTAPGGPATYERPNVLANPFAAGPVAANPDPACQKTISQGGKAADTTHTVASWFNACAFGVPASGTFGSLGRNAFNAPHAVNMDFSLIKKFPITERVGLRFRFEAFNVFNIQNYDVPANLTINSGSTTVNGVSVPAITAGSGRITGLSQGMQPRQLQFGLQLVF